MQEGAPASRSYRFIYSADLSEPFRVRLLRILDGTERQRGGNPERRLGKLNPTTCNDCTEAGSRRLADGDLKVQSSPGESPVAM